MFIALAALVSGAGMIIYRRQTGLSLWQSFFLSVLAAGVAALAVAYEASKPIYRRSDSFYDNQVFLLVCAGLLPLLALPFLIQLYRKWIGGHLTDAEKLPGMDGVRAWLTPGNLICAVLIPICVWRIFDVSLPVLFALTFGLLLAYPVFNMATASPQPAPAIPPEDLSAEREKVLQLLEAGKITADETAELLNALGQSVPPPVPKAVEMGMSPQRKIVLLGALLLLIGFFLPWFKVNLGQAMDEATSQIQQMMGSVMPANVVPQLNFSSNTSVVQVVQGGNIPHGLGWWILVLGIGAAVLPFFTTNLKADLQKKAILAALAVGTFLLIYLLSDTLRYVSIGVILALAGYALEFVGTLKERPAAR